MSGNRKYIYSILIALLIAICFNCRTQKKIEYNIGNDVGDEDRKLFLDRAEKGRILFKSHCTSCHGIFAKGKDSIPDFTHHQIDNYNARAIAQRASHSSVRMLSGEQLDYIMTFLRLRKVEAPK